MHCSKATGMLMLRFRISRGGMSDPVRSGTKLVTRVVDEFVREKVLSVFREADWKNARNRSAVPCEGSRRLWGRVGWRGREPGHVQQRCSQQAARSSGGG